LGPRPTLWLAPR